MAAKELMQDILALEEELLAFERRFGISSEVVYAAYENGEEPENESLVLDFGEGASVYRTWLERRKIYQQFERESE